MKISDIFNRQTVGQSLQSSNAERQQVEEKAREHHGLAGEDRISISPLSRQLQQVGRILGEDDEKQSVRIAELKQQVAEGSFNVSSENLARAIIDFSRDGEAA